MEQANILTVSEISELIRDVIGNVMKDDVCITGEISNMKLANGHLFVTLKDTSSSINAIQWNYSKKSKQIVLNNGDVIIVKGKIVCYPKSGSYNITINNIKKGKENKGDLHKEYELIREKYKNLGYFDDARKKKLPKYINKIGIITAAEGAALQDILYVFNKNKFTGKVIIQGCIVQGQSCPDSVATAIETLNKWRDDNGKPLDLLLVTRGGGSFEDLIGFSDPKVIEAIYQSPIFTISAVGHEVDYMLSDYVADLRAPTPSVAAELIAANQTSRNEEYNNIKNYVQNYLQKLILHKIDKYDLQLINLQQKNNNNNPKQRIDNQIAELNNIKLNLHNLLINKITAYEQKLIMLMSSLKHYNVEETLNNGFVLLLNNQNICDSINDVQVDQQLTLKFKDGLAKVMIVAVNHKQ